MLVRKVTFGGVMKKLTVIIFGLFFMASISFARPTIVKMCSDPWPPLNVGKVGEMATGGYAVKTLTEVFKRMDIKLELPIRPWKQCLKLVEHGQMDGLQSCVYSKKRSHYLDATDPWVIGKGSWYYMKERFPDGFEWESYDDFNDYKVVGYAGSAYGEDVDNAVKRGVLKLHRAKNAKSAIKVLAAGVHDFYLDFNLTGDYLFESAGLKDKYMSPKKPLYVNSQRFCIGKKSPLHTLIPEINEKLSELKAEGFIENVFKGSP